MRTKQAEENSICKRISKKKHAAEFEIKVIARLIPFPLKLHTTPFNHHSDGQSITIELESEKKII